MDGGLSQFGVAVGSLLHALCSRLVGWLRAPCSARGLPRRHLQVNSISFSLCRITSLCTFLQLRSGSLVLSTAPNPTLFITGQKAFGRGYYLFASPYVIITSSRYVLVYRRGLVTPILFNVTCVVLRDDQKHTKTQKVLRSGTIVGSYLTRGLSHGLGVFLNLAKRTSSCVNHG